MPIDFMIPQDQTIYENSDGYGVVRVVFDSGHSQCYRCYPNDFSDADKNKPCVKQWYDADLQMPSVVSYAGPTLATVKAAKISAIDARTTALIKSGFAFDGNNFSMSEAAQRNWIGLAAANANGMLSFPTGVSTVDEDTYAITDPVAFSGFLVAYLTYQVHPSAPLASGRALKALVNACESAAEVDAIGDTR